MSAPFRVKGFAVSESSVAVGGGVKTFEIVSGGEALPRFYTVQAESEEDADQWMVGLWDSADGVTGTLLVGGVSGVDYTGSDTLTRWRLKAVGTERPGLPIFNLSFTHAFLGGL